MHSQYKWFNTELGACTTLGRMEGVREVITEGQESLHEGQRVNCKAPSQKTRMCVEEPEYREESGEMHTTVR